MQFLGFQRRTGGNNYVNLYVVQYSLELNTLRCICVEVGAHAKLLPLDGALCSPRV